MDKYYTPSHIAASIINYVTTKNPSLIADFSAGNGDLLAAAASYWPKAKIIANDQDKIAVSSLRRRYPDWNVGSCDFIYKKSREGSYLLRSAKGSVSLTLLNPPFSCRGGTKKTIRIGPREITCSTSIAFLLTALEFVADTGEVLAILPRGTITSQKDSEAWTYINSIFSVSIIDTYPRSTFSGCYPATILTRLKKLSLPKPVYENRCCNEMHLQTFRVIRGTQQVHKLKKYYDQPVPGTIPFLHTTQMAVEVTPVCWVEQQGARIISHPAVLIPRVGEPRADKICTYLEPTEALISDCLIAVECPDDRVAMLLKKFIVERWEDFHRLYGGTCAKFVTIASLIKFLMNAETVLMAPWEESAPLSSLSAAI